MKCSIFIAPSVDGYIATEDGGVHWLETVGKTVSEKEASSDLMKHAYVDGGTTITTFLNLELINEMTLTLAPVLLGSGIPLFGKLFKQIKLEDTQATAFPNNFIEIKYKVKYL